MICIKSHPSAYPLPYIPMPPNFHISVPLFTWIYLYAYSLQYLRMSIDLRISLRLFTWIYLYAYSLGCICMPIHCDVSVCLSDTSVCLSTSICPYAYSLRYIHMSIDLQLDKASHVHVMHVVHVMHHIYIHIPIHMKLAPEVH